MEQVLSGRDDLSRLTDEELGAAIDDVQRQLREAEAALREWAEWNDLAAAAIAGHPLPRDNTSEEAEP
ncbi:hypothetical protein [Belnapia rosea]|uniref:Uncharacterized protein n=1 Tax=Belnapia rosea TaxID=938405 RepID=A0A1G6YUC3_9PROT|nr:hypothetical protein [Belnapia rosea]SDD94114.1 hypothetical protein SAMN04487779_101515 [Belnapia rosea]